MKKSIICVVLVLVMLTPCFSAGAAGFNDIGTHWAKETIEDMVDLGIIKGYSDNTFRPEQAVSKIESLILLARADGFADDSSEKYIDLAAEQYAALLDKYSIQYKDEVSYLLYKGVLTSGDLTLYVADSVSGESLKRYEAAVLLTKLMGAEDEAKAKTKYDMTYADVSGIPAEARGYVDYVSSKGIMKGMDANKFEPMYNVTRAQMATLLYRIIEIFDYSYVSGTLANYEFASDAVKISNEEGSKQYGVKTSVKGILDGESADISKFPIGCEIRLTLSGESVVLAEGISPVVEKKVTGIYGGYEKLTDATVLKVKDPVSGEEESYSLGSSYTFMKNGKSISLVDLNENDQIVLSLKDSKVFYAELSDKTQTVEGTIADIILEPEFVLVVNNGKNDTDYSVYDTVDVRRNGKIKELSDLMKGDSVTLTLSYGIVSDIKAQSSVSKREGTVQEIRISSSPAIIVKSGNSEFEYAVSRNVEITRNGADAEIYDIRLGDSVQITYEGLTVTSINLTSNTVGATLNGKIEYINTAYGYIKLEGSDMLIFINKAKIQDGTGKELTVKSLVAGVNITIFGSEGTGSYEANLIIINS